MTLLRRGPYCSGAKAGLSQFGVSHIVVPPGAWSSQSDWHSAKGELIYILEGHPTFITDTGARELSPGDVTTHPVDVPDGHHMINRTDMRVIFIVVGGRDTAHYRRH